MTISAGTAGASSGARRSAGLPSKFYGSMTNVESGFTRRKRCLASSPLGMLRHPDRRPLEAKMPTPVRRRVTFLTHLLATPCKSLNPLSPLFPPVPVVLSLSFSPSGTPPFTRRWATQPTLWRAWLRRQIPTAPTERLLANEGVGPAVTARLPIFKFPPPFSHLRSQVALSRKVYWGGRNYLPDFGDNRRSDH
jgi:hypothetical protein